MKIVTLLLLLFLGFTTQSEKPFCYPSPETPLLPLPKPANTPIKNIASPITTTTQNDKQTAGKFFYDIGKSVFDEGGYMTAHAFFIESAMFKNEDALFALAKYHTLGLGTIGKSQETAFAYLHEAALLGHVEACLMVSHHYRNGLVVKQDLLKALEFLTVPVRANNPSAFYAYGTLSFTLAQMRNSDAKDFVYWIQLAAKAGHADANYDIGRIMHASKLYSEAFNYLDIASVSGHFEANMLLGDMYQYGQGVQRNILTAILHYQKAYEIVGKPITMSAIKHALRVVISETLHGDAFAFYALAHCFLHGIGVLVNVDHSINLYKESLAAGMADSALRLLQIYLNIKGDRETAHHYAKIGAQMGVKQCQEYMVNGFPLS